MSGFRPRPLTVLEKSLILDIARGLTAEASGKRHGLTTYVVYERHKKLRALFGARTISHVVALAIAYGEIGHNEITRKDH